MFSARRALTMAFAVALAAAFVPSVAAAEDNLPPGTLSNNVSLKMLLPTLGEIVTAPALDLKFTPAATSSTPALRGLAQVLT